MKHAAATTVIAFAAFCVAPALFGVFGVVAGVQLQRAILRTAIRVWR